MSDGSAAGAVVEQVMDRANGTPPEAKFRTSVWPDDPEPVVGEPVVEYLTRRDLLGRGWTRRLVERFLPSRDGSRWVYCGYGQGTGLKYYYRRDRVERVEQTDRFRAALAETRRKAAARGEKPVTPPAPDPHPLALDVAQLKDRGWSEFLIGKFMPAPDAYDRRGSRNFRVYVVTRVEQVEATAEFRTALAEYQRWLAEFHARMEAERAEREAQWQVEREAERERELVRELEQKERERRKRESLATTFPGFDVSARVFNRGWGGEVVIDGVTAVVAGPEFCGLVRAAEQTGLWRPLVDWLAAHADAGKDRFRDALRFLAAGDPDGWRRWRESHPRAA